MMESMLSGALATGYLVAAAFFLKFWNASRDRLFALFAGAFLLLALQRALLPLVAFEQATMLYVIRLIAFILIIIAVVDKNRSGT